MISRAGGDRLQASDDGRRWRTLRQVDSAGAGLDTLFLPESQARWLQAEHDAAGAHA